ncbi:hypothetical protein BRADI_5g00955v3 [Brachypodium distachyon]|uniref:Uncharacterized protein n=1 Tax=Brachypodium distachyon TaxID=15368 RepID=A0A2K2CEQ3_BRADI|nr:hypothetical protein BRADI_5g00955v3 [Brachypodium distachyon]
MRGPKSTHRQEQIDRNSIRRPLRCPPRCFSNSILQRPAAPSFTAISCNYCPAPMHQAGAATSALLPGRSPHDAMAAPFPRLESRVRGRPDERRVVP